MIIFAHFDNKYLSIEKELRKYRVESDAVKARHPILVPFYLIKLLIKQNKIKVFVFRYVNDSNSFVLAVARVASEALTIFLLKCFNIEVWWLCHNIDKETAMFFPKLIAVRRRNIVKASRRIFTTSSLLIPKAKEMFPDSFIDSLSLGYIETGSLNIQRDEKNELLIKSWIDQRKSLQTKFIFCIGSPAKKSIHFKLIKNFVEILNVSSKFVWYAVVIGQEVENSKYIYNVPEKLALDRKTIESNANFFYRVMDDYSMSYSVYEAAQLKIPIITEDYGVMPDIVKRYNLGVVIDDYANLSQKLDNYFPDTENFVNFLNENNWSVTAKKMKFYYESIGPI